MTGFESQTGGDPGAHGRGDCRRSSRRKGWTKTASNSQSAVQKHSKEGKRKAKRLRQTATPGEGAGRKGRRPWLLHPPKPPAPLVALNPHLFTQDQWGARVISCPSASPQKRTPGRHSTTSQQSHHADPRFCRVPRSSMCLLPQEDTVATHATLLQNSSVKLFPAVLKPHQSGSGPRVGGAHAPGTPWAGLVTEA